jgi:hypothetical protein
VEEIGDIVQQYKEHKEQIYVYRNSKLSFGALLSSVKI